VRLGLAEEEVLPRGVRLPRPLSPHLAASLSGRTIELQPLLDDVAHDLSRDFWIIEGAGGALVPINDSNLMADLMVSVGLPIVIVGRTTLGTINHTLLTIEALRARALTIAGVLLVGQRNAENRQAIERYGRVNVVGELPILDPLTAEALRRWAVSELDRDGLLAKYFR
jgi:dethiobiotin synthetase